MATRSSTSSRSGRASAARPARAYAPLKKEAVKGELLRHIGALGERQAPYKHGDCLMEHSLAAVEQTNTIQHNEHTVGLRHRLSQSYGFFSYISPRGEAPQFGQTQGDIATAE